VSELEEGNLRDMLEQAVGEPPRWVSLDSIRRRAVQRRVTQASVAGLAVIAVGLGATLSAYAARNGPATSGAKTPSGPPKYYVVKDDSAKVVVIEVRARATGKVTSIVHDPLPKFSCGDLTPAGTRTFFMACHLWTKASKSRPSMVKATRIYRFAVTNSGRATTPVLLKGGTLKGLFGEDLAASQDGSHIAIEVTPPNPNGNLYTNSVSTGIFVINTKTGKRAFWRTGPYVPGRVGYTGSSDISLTRDGSELVVFELLCHRTRYFENCEPSDPRQVRAFGPADHGGSLQGGQVLLRLSAFKKPKTDLIHALITPDGTALTTVTIRCPRNAGCTTTVARISLTASQAPKVLYKVHTNFQGPYLENFASDPTGRFLIIDAKTSMTSKGPVNGWIDHGHVVPLAPSDGFDAIDEAW
jgi:hypothetical protein